MWSAIELKQRRIEELICTQAQRLFLWACGDAPAQLYTLNKSQHMAPLSCGPATTAANDTVHTETLILRRPLEATMKPPGRTTSFVRLFFTLCLLFLFYSAFTFPATGRADSVAGDKVVTLKSLATIWVCVCVFESQSDGRRMRAGESPQITGLGRVSRVCVSEIIFSVYSCSPHIPRSSPPSRQQY